MLTAELQNKALSKEKELLRSHVAALKEQLEAARGPVAMPSVLPPDVRTSAPTLPTPTNTMPSDSRASSPCGSILAAVPSSGRPLPLDMSHVGGAGPIGAASDAAVPSGSSSATPQESPLPGAASQSGEVGGARLIPPVSPATAMAIPAPVPAATIRSPFAGTQSMLAAVDASPLSPAAVLAEHARAVVPPREPSSPAQVAVSPGVSPGAPVAGAAGALGFAKDTEGAGVHMVAGAVAGATVAAALDTGSPSGLRPLSPVAEGHTEGSASSATALGDSAQCLTTRASADREPVAGSGGTSATSLPAAPPHDPPLAAAS